MKPLLLASSHRWLCIEADAWCKWTLLWVSLIGTPTNFFGGKCNNTHGATFCFPDTSLHPEIAESPWRRRAFTDVTTEKQHLRRNRAFRQDIAAVFDVHVHGQVRVCLHRASASTQSQRCNDASNSGVATCSGATLFVSIVFNETDIASSKVDADAWCKWPIRILPTYLVFLWDDITVAIALLLTCSDIFLLICLNPDEGDLNLV